ncbi:MAG: T9SS type A sorting domain-containing protein [Paludibacter sp.]
MKHIKLKTCAVLLLGIGLQVTQAQTSLFVKQKVGVITPFDLGTIKSLTFEAGFVTVNKKDASSSSFERTNVQYMNFGVNPTEIAPINEEQNYTLSLFPNPVQDILNVNYSTENPQNTYLEIVGIDGKVALKSSLGNAKSSISVSSLPRGFYVCRIINGTKTTTAKFIKQ